MKAKEMFLKRFNWKSNFQTPDVLYYDEHINHTRFEVSKWRALDKSKIYWVTTLHWNNLTSSPFSVVLYSEEHVKKYISMVKELLDSMGNREIEVLKHLVFVDPIDTDADWQIIYRWRDSNWNTFDTCGNTIIG